MDIDATVKTCPKGCHVYKVWSDDEPGWMERIDEDDDLFLAYAKPCSVVPGGEQDMVYCERSHAELLPGGEVVEMVPLETAVGSHVLANTQAHSHDASYWRDYLRKAGAENGN